MGTRDPFSRRELLGGRLFGKIAHHLAGEVEKRIDAVDRSMRQATTPPPKPPLPVLHRPPGAVDEIAFTAQCTKCDACLRACPAGAIKHAGAFFGKAAGTPIIEPRDKACVMCDELPCVAACVSEGASVLHPALPPKMGTARIIRPSCLPYNGTSCDACVQACPVEGAIELRGGVPVIHERVCTGCGLCQQVCPAPRNAVAIIPLGQRPPMPGETERGGAEDAES
ncbi:MAG: 4Fe-4S dicluster domain-containing protein [Phycisphaeraceae bacterium]|nr:MAG: 4Fe-4S dicluster domain-containing protein [Phycisphaeraceae bacterium]